ncbi:MFS transporter [Embleya scabrispora]|uniref:MFS transporter n=1 Tax=Embleya scabrispora TaxID=159449 RepID=UPI0003770666|nr:MFS transporter [Embleya scabrispora]MYS82543.1 MFS transporter [Streptomyces sp. SID5474]
MTPATRRLLLGRTFAALATALIPTTLTLALVHTGSGTDLGLVLACELLPMLLLLPVAGVIADRFPPHRVILAADLVRAGAQLAIGAELLAGPVRIPDLAILSALTGAAVAFGISPIHTLVVAVVPESERLRVNARLGVAQGLAQVAAPAAAGALMLAVGAGWSSLLTGLLFVASAATFGGLRPERVERRHERGPFLGELHAGWVETRRHPWFLANVVAHGVWHLAAGFLLTLGPIIAVDRLGGDRSWVIIAQVGTVGVLLGALIASRLPVRRPLVATSIGAALYGFPLAALALRAPLTVVAVAYFVAMFGLGVLSPLWETTLQHRIPPEALGRVGSFDTLISFATRPLGLAIAAPVATAIGTSTPLLVGAVLVVATNAGLLLLPDVRAIESASKADAAPRAEAPSAPAQSTTEAHRADLATAAQTALATPGHTAVTTPPE